MGVAEEAELWRLGPKVYELCSFRLKDSSVTSMTVQRSFIVGGAIPPRRFVDAGERHRHRPRGRKFFPRCKEPSRSDCGALRPSYTEGIGPDQLPCTDLEKNHARRWKRPTTTHRRSSRQRHTGFAEAAGLWRLVPKFNGLCSFRLNVSSVTSVRVELALHGGGGIPQPSAWGRRGTPPQTPPGAEEFFTAQRT
jgi:hypothetical protein